MDVKIQLLKMTNSLAISAILTAVVVGCVTCTCNQRRVLTYNVALTPTVAGYDQRRHAVVGVLDREAAQADFLCLQELWFEEDMQRILDRLESTFPYHYSAIHHDVGQLRDSSDSKWSWVPKRWKTVPCDTLKLLRLLTCFGMKCLKSGHQQQCMMEQCQSHMYGVSQTCRSCISLSSSGPRDVMAQCGNLLRHTNRVNSPGLLVLSKRPLTQVQYVDYHEGRKVLVERGYIKAQIEGDPTYVCTHLTPVLPHYYDMALTMFSNYEKMQATEIHHLYTDFFSTPHLLMGDLNTGPQRNDPGQPVLKGEAPDNYQMLVRRLDYWNPYLQMDGRCTYCRMENPVLWSASTPPDSEDETAIDHVLVSRSVANVEDINARRMFDQPNVKLSDHYGVQVDMCLRP